MIGFFDSGMGGLTVLSVFKTVFPEAATLYYACNLRGPIGRLSQKELREIWKRAKGVFESHHVSHIIIACHTMSSALFCEEEEATLISNPALIENLPDVALLATRATLESGLYQERCPQIALAIDGSDLVAHIEDGKTPWDRLQSLLFPIIGHGRIRHIYLGCTHFPFLRPAMEKVLKQHGLSPAWINPAESLPLLSRSPDSFLSGPDLFISDTPSPFAQKLHAKIVKK
ncbi:MAG: hypothetical protein A3F09_02125 [Chlamydiae bacterium RIFCSPHIGHO2_12_FULL_49_11]|nr:MAG: hypothetical protein A3F09_02125 [Chlamydiae bacterium RIFCSPHIGHO2_12_FULL_49_11]